MTFEEFAASALPELLRFSKVLCSDRGLAEDLVQDVMIRAHAKWDRIGPMEHPYAYVRRMLVNEFVSWRRRWGRISVTDEVPDRPADVDPTDQLADREQLVAELGRLPRRQRAVLVLRYYGGLSDTEIAEELGCGHGTVRSHMSRGLHALRVGLAESATSAERSS